MAAGLLSETLRASISYVNLDPGVSSRDLAIAALGPPTGGEGTLVTEHKPQEGTGNITVEYRPATVLVDRIEVRFLGPIARAAFVQGLGLPPEGDKQIARDSEALVEWFDAPNHVALLYGGKDAASGVVSMNYYSPQLYECRHAVARGSNTSTVCAGLSVTAGAPAGAAAPMSAASAPPDGASAAPGAPASPAAPPVSLGDTLPPSVKRNPAACYDVYLWADGQELAARRANNLLRRQAAMTIRLAAQSGDCDRARASMATYKQRFP